MFKKSFNLKAGSLKLKADKGFTLIELLVVIAIIGILSSVVLASLNTARQKGADAAIKADLANLRAQTELYYDTNTSYATGTGMAPNTTCPIVLGTITNALNDTNAINILKHAKTQVGAGPLLCGVDANSWAVIGKLKSVAGYFCVDSTGSAKTVTGSALLPATGTTGIMCPAL